MNSYIGATGLKLSDEILLISSNFTIQTSNIIIDYVDTRDNEILNYVDTTSNSIIDYVDMLEFNNQIQFSHLSNIIGLDDINNDISVLSPYGNDIIEILSSIGFIEDLNPLKTDFHNRYVYRISDFDPNQTNSYNFGPFYDLQNLIYNTVLGFPFIDENTQFVIIGNMYPFPYEVIKYVTEQPFPFFGKAPINIYERFTDTSNIVYNVEMIKEILAEHEIRITTNEFQSSVNPATSAMKIGKWVVRTLKPFSQKILLRLIDFFNPTSSLFSYQRLIDYDDDLLEAVVDQLDTDQLLQNITNTGFSSAIVKIESEIKAIQGITGILGGATALNSLFNLGTFIGDAIEFFSSDESGTPIQLNTFNEDIWFVFHKEPTDTEFLENLSTLTINTFKLDGYIHNPNNEIVKNQGLYLKNQWEYTNGTDNYLDIFKDDNDTAKQALLRWENKFSISLRLYFKTDNPLTIFKIYDDIFQSVIIEIKYDFWTFTILICDIEGLPLNSLSLPYTVQLNQWKHFVFIFDNTITNQITTSLYEDKILKQTLTETSVFTNYIMLNPVSLRIRALMNLNNVIVEDFRLFQKVLTETEITKLFDVYSPLETLEDIKLLITNNTNDISSHNIRITNIENDYLTSDDKLWINTNTSIRYKNVEVFDDYIDVLRYDILDTPQKYPNLPFTDSSKVKISSENFSSKMNQFNGNNTSYVTYQNNYTNGILNGNVPDYFIDYRGEYTMIELPVSILLTSVKIYARNGFVRRSPGIFRVYATNDITGFNDLNYNVWIVLGETQIKAEYVNNEYNLYIDVSKDRIKYKYFAIVINELQGNDLGANYDELELYGLETFDNLLEIRTKILNNDEVSSLITNTSNILSKRINDIQPLFTDNITSLRYRDIELNEKDIRIYQYEVVNPVIEKFPEIAYGYDDVNKVNQSTVSFDSKTNQFDNDYNTTTFYGSEYTNGVINIGNSFFPQYDGEYVMVDVSAFINLEYIKIYSRPGYQNRSPKKFRIYGTNDVSAISNSLFNVWFFLGETDNAIYVNDVCTLNINATKSYSIYALVIQELIGNESSINYNELEFYGVKNAVYNETYIDILENLTTIQADYLTSTDKTELNGLITTNSGNITTNTGNISSHNTRITNIENNYLTSAQINSLVDNLWDVNPENTIIHTMKAVGIGINNPVVLFHVAGSILSENTLFSTYLDVINIASFHSNVVIDKDLNVKTDVLIENDLTVNNHIQTNTLDVTLDITSKRLITESDVLIGNDLNVNNNAFINNQLIVNNNYEYSNIDTFITEYNVNVYWKGLSDGVKNLVNDNYYSPSYTTSYNNVCNDYVMTYYNETDTGYLKIVDYSDVGSGFSTFTLCCYLLLDNTSYYKDSRIFNCWLGGVGSYIRYFVNLLIIDDNTITLKFTTRYEIFSTTFNLNVIEKHFYIFSLTPNYFIAYADGNKIAEFNFTTETDFTLREIFLGAPEPVGVSPFQNTSILHYNDVFFLEDYYVGNGYTIAEYFYKRLQSYNQPITTFLLGKTYIQQLNYNELYSDGVRYYTNSITNFSLNNEILQDEQLYYNNDNSRRSLMIGTEKLNSVNNLINNTNNSGFLYYTDNIVSTQAQLKTLSINDVVNLQTSLDAKQDLITNTDDISEGLINLYYTDARFDTRFNTKTTTNLTEGTNLYYTDSRFDTRFNTKTSDDISEGTTNLYYTTVRANLKQDVLFTDNTTYISYGNIDIYNNQIRINDMVIGNLTKYPEIPFTANEDNINYLRVSSFHPAFPSYRYFDHNLNTEGHSLNDFINGVINGSHNYFENYNGFYLMVNIQQQIKLSQVKFYRRAASDFLGRPSIFRIYGTNDLSKLTTPDFTGWNLIHDQTTHQYNGIEDTDPFIYDITTNEIYSIFTLVVQELAGNTSYLIMKEFELYGYPLVSSGYSTLIDDVMLENTSNNLINYVNSQNHFDGDYNSLINIPSTFTPSSHTHLWVDITDKPSSFTPSSHNHSISEITNLQISLDNKQDVVLNVSSTEIGYLDGVTSSIQSQINNKANSSHLHSISDVTNLQTSLDSKQNIIWNTSGANIYFNTANVGIGVVPSDKLHINNGRLRVDNLGTLSLHPDCEFQADAAGVVGGRMIILSNGNVGIGINNPLHKLSVIGDINYSGTLYKNSVDILQFLDVSSSIQTQINNKQDVITNSDSITEGTTNLFYTTARANLKQDVITNSDSITEGTTNLYYTTARANLKQDVIWNTSGVNIYFNTGNVGIGIVPSDKLHIQSGRLRLDNLATLSLHPDCEFQADAVNIVGGRMIIKGNGNVGINNNNPSYKLDVSGDINYSGTLRKSGVDVLQYLDASSSIQNQINTINNRNVIASFYQFSSGGGVKTFRYNFSGLNSHYNFGETIRMFEIVVISSADFGDGTITRAHYHFTVSSYAGEKWAIQTEYEYNVNSKDIISANTLQLIVPDTVSGLTGYIISRI